MKTVLIETPGNSATEWGVSFGSANPLPSEYVACKSRDDAVRLCETMDRMLSLLAERFECSIYEEQVLPAIQDAWQPNRALVAELTAHMR